MSNIPHIQPGEKSDGKFVENIVEENKVKGKTALSQPKEDSTNCNPIS